MMVVYILGLYASILGLVATTRSFVAWHEQTDELDDELDDAVSVARDFPAEIVFEGKPVELAVAWFGETDKYDVFEVVPRPDGRRRLAIRSAAPGGSDRLVVRLSVPRQSPVHA